MFCYIETFLFQHVNQAKEAKRGENVPALKKIVDIPYPVQRKLEKSTNEDESRIPFMLPGSMSKTSHENLVAKRIAYHNAHPEGPSLYKGMHLKTKTGNPQARNNEERLSPKNVHIPSKKIVMKKQKGIQSNKRLYSKLLDGKDF